MRLVAGRAPRVMVQFEMKNVTTKTSHVPNDETLPDAQVGHDRFLHRHEQPRMGKPKRRRPSMRAVTQARPIRVNLFYSPEAKGYWANSPDLSGLSASGNTRAEVMQDAQDAAELLLELDGATVKPELSFEDAVYKPE